MTEVYVRPTPGSTVLRNPGSFDRCDVDIQKILLLDIFEGVRLDAQRLLGPLLVTSSAGVTSFDKEKKIVYNASSLLAFGDAVVTGRINHLNRASGEWAHDYTGSFSRWSHRIQGFATPADASVEARFERKGDDHTLGLKVSDTVAGISLFQAVSPRLDMGLEMELNIKAQTPQVVTKARYAFNDGTVVATASALGLITLSGLYKHDKHLSVALDSHVSALNWAQPTAMVGVQYEMSNAKANVNLVSSGLIQATVLDKVTPNVALLWSATIDPLRDSYKFGTGIQLS